MHRRTKAVIGLLGVTTVVGGTGVAIATDEERDTSANLAAQLDSSKPKNVILLVGDGGSSELTIGRYYLNGAKGVPMAYETLPFTGNC